VHDNFPGQPTWTTGPGKLLRLGMALCYHPPMIQSPPLLSAARHNLRQLTNIRYIALGSLGLALAALSPDLAREPGLLALAALLGLFAVLNALVRWRIRRPLPISETEFFSHLLLDIGGLGGLLFFSGGATNPLISYYLVPVSIAAATLNRTLAWSVTALAFACYSLLLIFYQPIPALLPTTHHDGFNLHVLGMWANFAVSAALISYFLFNMAETLRRQQQQIAQQREEQLRDEQLLSVASLAASAAHELGTPLNTMKLLIDAARDDRDGLAGPGFDILDQQLERCRETLKKLAHAAGIRDQQPQPQQVDTYLRNLLAHWQVLRPSAIAELRLNPAHPDVSALFHPALEPALQNLLDNAADASPRITVEADWTPAILTIRIRDYGPGIAPEQRQYLGQPGRSAKPHGLGLGLFLSHSTIGRHGGAVELRTTEGDGTLTRITLPLAGPGR
jgi:two-component system sensor histidine kinase RegB